MTIETITRSTCDRCGKRHDGDGVPKSWAVVDFCQRSSGIYGGATQNDADICQTCYFDLLRWWDAPLRMERQA